MKKKTAEKLSGIKGRSKIPSLLANWMAKTEKKYGNKIAKVDLEATEPTRGVGGDSDEGWNLRAIYYANENGYWKILDVGMIDTTEEVVNSLFEDYANYDKAALLSQLTEDHDTIKNWMDALFERRPDLMEVDKTTDEKVKSVFKSISKEIDPDDEHEVVVRGGIYSKSIRKYDYFTPRKGEEDDDFPDFTKSDKVRKSVEKHLKDAGVKASRVLVNPDEKSWFTITVNL